jgi:hypothetical protein
MGDSVGAAPIKCEPSASGRAGRSVLWIIGTGVGCYVLTSAVVIVGACAGRTLLKPGGPPRWEERNDPLTWFASWDGVWYCRIAEGGYVYQPGRPSRVAFFPLYPFLASGLARFAGMDYLLALLVVSHVSLATAFAVGWAYSRRRLATGPPTASGFALLSAGLLPATLFFRMAYTESLFLLLVVVTLHGMERRWPLAAVAAVIGVATAVRPTGVGLLLPLIWYVWQRPESGARRVAHLAALLPLGIGGMVAYATYLWIAFGDPLAFAHAQSNWRIREPVPIAQKVECLITLEPVRSVFDPASPCYWARRDGAAPAPFNYNLVNPIYFLGTAGVILLGAAKRWLLPQETLLGVGLLLAAYYGRGYEMGMVGAARFASVVFPAYLVVGQLLARLPLPLAGGILACAAGGLFVYSAMFAAWYKVI